MFIQSRKEITMLTTIKNFLINLAKGSSAIKLEDAVIHDGKKLSVIMSKKDYMASFEVIPNMEYDFLVINSNDEAIILNKSKKLKDILELLTELEEDYNAFAQQ
jgi:hypothetical protein